MRRRPTKSETRQSMQSEVDEFLSNGGVVKSVPQGISGRDHPEKALHPPVFNEPAQPRTDVTEVLHELDSRKKKPKSSPKPTSRRQKKAIYDDFGELVRWVWVE